MNDLQMDMITAAMGEMNVRITTPRIVENETWVSSTYVTVTIPITLAGIVIGKQGGQIRKLYKETQCSFSVENHENDEKSTITIQGICPQRGLDAVRNLLEPRGTPANELKPRVTRLIVDGSAVLIDFLFRKDESWSVFLAEIRAKALVDSATASGVGLKIFFDSLRTENSPFPRCLQEVRDGVCDKPQSANELACLIFTRLGVTCLFCGRIGIDEALSAHAHADRADILSPSKELLSYREKGTRPNYRVFSSFVIDEDRVFNLVLHWRSNQSPTQLGVTPRVVRPSPPRMHVYHQEFTEVLTRDVYERGVASPLVRRFASNPHITARPLRSALFATLGIQSVTEIFPVWVNGNAMYDETEVACVCSPKENELLRAENSDEAFAYLFPVKAPDEAPPADISENDWVKHVFACRAIVAEIWCAFPCEGRRNLLEEMKRIGF